MLYSLKIIRTIEIIDVSGTAVLRSPQMQELLKLMEVPEVHGVVAREFSRLMRPENFADYALLQHFIDTGTILYLPEGPIDLASKTGRLYGTVRAAMAGLERREILERMNDAKEAMRRAGKHSGGSNLLPYGVGYSKEDGWYYTADAEKVKKAFKLFLSGKGYQEIARRLNLPRTNIRFILSNPIYTGWRVYEEKRDPTPAGYVARKNGRQGDRRKIKRAPEEIIRVQVLDPLVSEADFARVQEKVELKRCKHWRSRAETSGRFIYNGYLVCGECGCPVYTHTSLYDYYVCKSHNVRERRKRKEKGLEPCSNRHMLRTKLEPKIDHLLAGKLQEREFLSRIVDAYNEKLGRPQQTTTISREEVEQKLEVLQSKKERILEAFLDGVIGKEERERRMNEVDRESDVFIGLLAAAETKKEDTSELDVDTVLALVEPFADWEFLDRDDKRSMLVGLCPEIGVTYYELKHLVLRQVDCNEDSRMRTAR
jgi:DNA invertase Pin-like site-specific DNA recombinase